MVSRYSARTINLNIDSSYDDFFAKRKVGFINQFKTPNLRVPTSNEIANLDVINHVWKVGDRFWKLASKYYNDQGNLWWVIAWFNNTPTEGHVKVGDVVYVPLPLEKILDYLDV